MAKTILGVLSLLVIMSCSIPVKENTVQPNIMETNKKVQVHQMSIVRLAEIPRIIPRMICF